jgi:hypothetical protein
LLKKFFIEGMQYLCGFAEFLPIKQKIKALQLTVLSFKFEPVKL